MHWSELGERALPLLAFVLFISVVAELADRAGVFEVLADRMALAARGSVVGAVAARRRAGHGRHRGAVPRHDRGPAHAGRAGAGRPARAVAGGVRVHHRVAGQHGVALPAGLEPDEPAVAAPPRLLLARVRRPHLAGRRHGCRRDGAGPGASSSDGRCAGGTDARRSRTRTTGCSSSSRSWSAVALAVAFALGAEIAVASGLGALVLVVAFLVRDRAGARPGRWSRGDCSSVSHCSCSWVRRSGRVACSTGSRGQPAPEPGRSTSCASPGSVPSGRTWSATSRRTSPSSPRSTAPRTGWPRCWSASTSARSSRRGPASPPCSGPRAAGRPVSRSTGAGSCCAAWCWRRWPSSPRHCAGTVLSELDLGLEAPPPGFEPGTCRVETDRSIQLSYGGWLSTSIH